MNETQENMHSSAFGDTFSVGSQVITKGGLTKLEYLAMKLYADGVQRLLPSTIEEDRMVANGALTIARDFFEESDKWNNNDDS